MLPEWCKQWVLWESPDWKNNHCSLVQSGKVAQRKQILNWVVKNKVRKPERMRQGLQLVSTEWVKLYRKVREPSDCSILLMMVSYSPQWTLNSSSHSWSPTLSLTKSDCLTSCHFWVCFLKSKRQFCRWIWAQTLIYSLYPHSRNTLFRSVYSLAVFEIGIQLWNHHDNQANPRLSKFPYKSFYVTAHPLLAFPGNHRSAFCYCRLLCIF